MFIAALFIIAKIWKQFKYPLTDEWMNVYSIACKWEYKSVIKQTNNVIIQFTATWMNLEGIMLSELIQTDKDKYHMRQIMCGI